MTNDGKPLESCGTTEVPATDAEAFKHSSLIPPRYVWVAICFIDGEHTDVLGVYCDPETARRRVDRKDREGWIERHELRDAESAKAPQNASVAELSAHQPIMTPSLSSSSSSPVTAETTTNDDDHGIQRTTEVTLEGCGGVVEHSSSIDRQKALWACREIAADMARDAAAFDGQPFNGRTVAEYFGNQGAAIAALAGIVAHLLADDAYTAAVTREARR